MFASAFLVPSTLTRGDWLGLGLQTWMLSADAATVMSLRAMKFAAGGAAAQAEANLAVSEKVEAMLALQTQALTGGLGANPHAAARRTLTHYRRKVRANRRRLLKG